MGLRIVILSEELYCGCTLCSDVLLYTQMQHKYSDPVPILTVQSCSIPMNHDTPQTYSFNPPKMYTVG